MLDGPPTKKGMETDDLLMRSRNARPQKALVERAQCEDRFKPPSLKNERASSEGPFLVESLAPILAGFMEQDMPVRILSS